MRVRAQPPRRRFAGRGRRAAADEGDQGEGEGEGEVAAQRRVKVTPTIQPSRKVGTDTSPLHCAYGFRLS